MLTELPLSAVTTGQIEYLRIDDFLDRPALAANVHCTLDLALHHLGDIDLRLPSLLLHFIELLLDTSQHGQSQILKIPNVEIGVYTALNY